MAKLESGQSEFNIQRNINYAIRHSESSKKQAAQGEVQFFELFRISKTWHAEIQH